MANKNLTHKLTAEELHRGGVNSVESRRRRKTLKEELLLLLEDEEIQKNMAVALITEATKGNNAGSVKGAFETVRDTIGEKPVDKVESTTKVVDMSKYTTEQIKEMLDDDIS